MATFDNFDFKNEELEKFWSLVEFQGFNIRNVRDKITQTMTEKEVAQVISFYLSRGTKWDAKAQGKTKKLGRDTLESLFKARRIVTSSKPGPEDLTISRIAICFPKLTGRMLAHPKARVIGSVPRGLKRQLCWPGAPSVIPRDDDATFLLWQEWAKSFSSVIGGKPNEAIWKASWNSDLYTNEEREAIIQDYS
jgi:hypothetical protein